MFFVDLLIDEKGLGLEEEFNRKYCRLCQRWKMKNFGFEVLKLKILMIILTNLHLKYAPKKRKWVKYGSLVPKQSHLIPKSQFKSLVYF